MTQSEYDNTPSSAHVSSSEEGARGASGAGAPAEALAATGRTVCQLGCSEALHRHIGIVGARDPRLGPPWPPGMLQTVGFGRTAAAASARLRRTAPRLWSVAGRRLPTPAAACCTS